MSDSVSLKIKTLDELSPLIEALRAEGKKIVHCHGVFDLVHVGHLRHFRAAREFGDILVVTLTADEFVNKGPNRPIFTQNLRAESLASLSFIDFVAVNPAASAINAIDKVHPHYYVKGQDYRARLETKGSKLVGEAEAVRKGGGELVFTEDIQFSSSALINEHFSPYTKKVTDYLSGLKALYTPTAVERFLDEIRKLRVLIIGESFIEELRTFRPSTSTPGRQPPTGLVVGRERSSGGTALNAHYLAGLCDSVTLFSPYRSAPGKMAETPRAGLVVISPETSGKFHFTRERTIDDQTSRPILECWSGEGGTLSEESEERVLKELRLLVKSADVVLVTDYCTGFISRAMIHAICDEAKYLAVTLRPSSFCQIYRTASHYPRADYLQLDPSTLEQEMRQSEVDPLVALGKVFSRMDLKLACLTSLTEGVLVRTRQGESFNAPILTEPTTQILTSGVPEFIVPALFAATQTPQQLLPLMGSIVLEKLVGSPLHPADVSSSAIRRVVQSLLK